MAEINNALESTIQKISEVSDLFYQQKEQEAYNELNDLLPVVSDALGKIYQWDLEHNVLGQVQQDILKILGEAMQAMETRDSILLADILQYDLKEQFENVLEKVQ